VQLNPTLPIAAAVTWLPAERATVSEAIAARLIGRAEAERNAFAELPVSHDLHPPEMAVEAATDALAAANWSASTIDLVLHAWTHHQGHEFWSPAHFVARRIQARRAVPVGIQQMCNGGAAAIELAAGLLQGNPATRRALVTTADRFSAPAFNRWGSDFGIAYGDGATAVLLGDDDARPGGLDLVAIATVADADLEEMHRGHEPFDQAPTGPVPLDIRRRKRAYIRADNNRDRFAISVARGAQAAVERALDDADLEAQDVTCVALPRVGRSILEQAYASTLVLLDRAVPLILTARTGHLGAGDVAANLADIIAEQRLRPADVAAVIGAGGGFTWTCAIVRAR
jgi:3-oxoacyl-[acyl-carrier-protein] synthase-3